MQNDLKPALTVGVLLVAIVAVVFYRESPSPSLEEPLPPAEVEEGMASDLPPTVNQRAATDQGSSSRSGWNGSDTSKMTRTSPRSPTNSNRTPQRSRPTRRSPTIASGQPQAQVAWADRTYLVREDDTLIDIARQVYGDGNAYGEIYRANRDQLSSPGQLRAGMRLRLPR